MVNIVVNIFKLCFCLLLLGILLSISVSTCSFDGADTDTSLTSPPVSTPSAQTSKSDPSTKSTSPTKKETDKKTSNTAKCISGNYAYLCSKKRSSQEREKYFQYYQTLNTNSLITKPEDMTLAYNRGKYFNKSWGKPTGIDTKCDTRNYVLAEAIKKYDKTHNTNTLTYKSSSSCIVKSGTLFDVYTGKNVDFVRGRSTSSKVQIDHIVALKDAWGSGAQSWEQNRRVELANDLENLLPVDGKENMSKGDGVNPLWLPLRYESYVCEYIAKRIHVKQKYKLWLLADEQETSKTILNNCSVNS